jgi:WD40 repeat protein
MLCDLSRKNDHTMRCLHRYLIVSGCDDGSFRVWDLRQFAAGTPAAHFKWHTQPVCDVTRYV